MKTSIVVLLLALLVTLAFADPEASTNWRGNKGNSDVRSSCNAPSHSRDH